ncbi:MAG: NACHT domain-containing protein [Calothrix sp. CSU_2_0]|nr:NACHT domain-containing protein [Calothrix sp. CSU_2_0]
MAETSEPVEPEFHKYFASISEKYNRWWNFYTLTDTLDRQSQDKAGFSSFDSPFDFGLMVEKVEPKQDKQEKRDRLPVLEAIRKYATEHVLLVGKPGSGKSTALQRLLWEEVRAIIQGEKRKIPVLIELRRWDTSLETLIYKVLRSHKYRVDKEKIEDLLVDGELLLLMDGLNELPSDEARDKVAKFRQDYPDTGMVFTTRDLALGGNLGIDEQLEIQPLTVNQIKNIIRNYFPESGENLLRQLENRLRELGETPFILKMLCEIFESSGEIPKNKGELFSKFDSKVNYFKENKEPVPIPEGLRSKKKELLSYLAFEMMQSENPQVNPVGFRLSISRDRAEAILEKFLTGKIEYPWEKAKDYLEGLLKHCLLESTTSELDRVTIQFHHQLFQEYYAAEYLLRLLPSLSDRTLQRDYLNLLKWTESIAIVLALVEDEGQAVHIVQLALDVDLMLGSRLAGEVQEKFQERAKIFIDKLKIPIEHKKFLSILSSHTITKVRYNFEQKWEDNMIEIGGYQPTFYVDENGIPVIDYTQDQKDEKESIYYVNGVVYNNEKSS